MPIVRPMSGLAAVLQTWPLGDSIGVRQQYPAVRHVPRSHLDCEHQGNRIGRRPSNCSDLRLSGVGPEIIAVLGPDYLRL